MTDLDIRRCSDSITRIVMQTRIFGALGDVVVSTRLPSGEEFDLSVPEDIADDRVHLEVTHVLRKLAQK